MQLYSKCNLNVFNLTGLHFNHLDLNSFLPKIEELRSSAKLSDAAVKGISELKHIDNYNTLCRDNNRHG